MAANISYRIITVHLRVVLRGSVRNANLVVQVSIFLLLFQFLLTDPIILYFSPAKARLIVRMELVNSIF